MTLASSKLRRRILLLAAVQGVAGDALLRVGPWGINLAVWALIGIIGLGLVGRGGGGLQAEGVAEGEPRDSKSPPAWFWLAGAGVCALLVAGRDAEFLTGLTVLAGIGCLVMAAWSARGGRPATAPVTDHAAQAAQTALHAGLGGFVWLLRWVTHGATSRQAPPPVRIGWRCAGGFLAAVPVLLVFGGLFASADPVFEKGLRVVTVLDFPTLASHAFVVAAWSWVSLGYVSRVFLPAPYDEARTFAPGAPSRAPVVEVVTGLSLLTALFLAFVVVQLRYLFGSDELVVTTVGLTYAEYARRGFFELVGVAALLIPLLLACDWLLGSDKSRRSWRVLAVALLLLLAMIMVSAWKRLGLYTGAYGWTEPRLYAAAVLIALALVAIWFAATVIPGRRELFAGGVLGIGLATLLGLHAMNPDAFIARHNLARAARGASFDVEHARHLGADAAPLLWNGLNVLNDEDRKKLRGTLVRRWSKPDNDWRVWNFARSKAKKMVGDAVRTESIRDASKSGNLNATGSKP